MSSGDEWGNIDQDTYWGCTGVAATGRVGIVEEDSQLVGDPEQVHQTTGSETKARKYPHLTERGTSSLLGGLGVSVTLHVATVPGVDNDTLDSRHFASKRLIVEKVVRSVQWRRVYVAPLRAVQSMTSCNSRNRR